MRVYEVINTKGEKRDIALVYGFFISAFLLAFLFLHTVIFPAASSNATTAGSEVGVGVKEFIKLAVDTNTITLKDENDNTIVTPSASGTLIQGDMNVAVTTNSEKGYTLSIYTADSSKNMTHVNTSINTNIASLDSVSGYDASTGASSLSNNTWGFQKSSKGGSATGNWFAVGASSANGTIIDSPNSDDTAYCENLSYPLNSTGCNSNTYSTYNINFGAKLTNSLPAGTYTNNVIFSAVAKSEGTKYTINFDANGGIGSMAPKTILAGSTATLPNGTFEKSDYGIAGWALTSGAITATYTAGQTVAVNDLVTAAQTAGQTPDNGITLYAIWTASHTVTINSGTGIASVTGSGTYNVGQTVNISASPSSGYKFSSWTVNSGGASLASTTSASTSFTMPDADVTITANGELDKIFFQTANSCSTITAGNTGTLTDSRDNQEYSVYRIPDSSAATNIRGKCFMTKDLNLGAVAFASTASSTMNTANTDMTLSPLDSNFTSPSGSGESITVPTSDVTVNMAWNTSNNYSNRHYHTNGTENYAGRGYYSWGAAMVVCPKGWRLPTSDELNNSDSWNASTSGISQAAGNSLSTIMASPYSFVLGGEYDNGFYGADSSGSYWSSTQYDSLNAYTLYLNSSIGLVRSDRRKRYGYAVRCIAE